MLAYTELEAHITFVLSQCLLQSRFDDVLVPSSKDTTNENILFNLDIVLAPKLASMLVSNTMQGIFFANAIVFSVRLSQRSSDDTYFGLFGRMISSR
jgi:hypothetical protein